MNKRQFYCLYFLGLAILLLCVPVTGDPGDMVIFSCTLLCLVISAVLLSGVNKGMKILLLATALLLCGCTDRITYRHDLERNIIQISYSEGVGNSDKQDICVVLPDGATLTLGRSATDQDAFMSVLRQYGLTAERIAEAWMASMPGGLLPDVVINKDDPAAQSFGDCKP